MAKEKKCHPRAGGRTALSTLVLSARGHQGGDLFKQVQTCFLIISLLRGAFRTQTKSLRSIVCLAKRPSPQKITRVALGKDCLSREHFETGAAKAS